MANLRITILGCGTSSGVPIPTCECSVCKSNDPRNRRLRCSALIELSVENDPKYILIDTGPDLRQQALTYRIPQIDAILYTHAHSDHTSGLDDTRPYSHKAGGKLSAYATAPCFEDIRRRFDYAFRQDADPRLAIPKIEHLCISGGESFSLFGAPVIPVPLVHATIDTIGFRIGNLAYLTDCKSISQESLKLVEGVDTLVIDALRYKEHPQHMTVAEAITVIEAIKPKMSYFTHLSHDIDYIVDSEKLKSMTNLDVRLCYDGLVIEASY